MPKILKLHIELIYTEVWREILIESDRTFHELHEVLQIIFEWKNYHLREFTISRDKSIGPDKREEIIPGRTGLDEKDTELSEFLQSEGDSIDYMYDFGDGWKHTIEVKEILAKDEIDKYDTFPAVIDGEKKAPPEDCGGPPGYERVLEAFNNPNNIEHEELLDWLEDDFDPEEFDKESMNEALAKTC